MPIITTANVAEAIVKLVATDALPALVGNLVMGNLVNRNYEPTLAASGDTVNVPIPPIMQANNLALGGTVQTQNPSLGNAQVVLNTHAESTFQIPDIVKVLAFPELLAQYLRPAMIAIAERIETDLLSLYVNLTANSPVGASNTPITESVIDAAETALFSAKVPEAEEKIAVVSAQTYSDLRQIQRFTEERTIGTGFAIISGMVGKLKNFNFFRSQFVQKVSSTTYNIGFAKDAFALVMRRLPQPLPGTGAVAEYAEMGNFGMRIVMSYSPNVLAQQFTVDVLYGCAVLRNVFGVQIQS
jgi:P22 coat protein - gene protein 5